jgi:hypothetical protein
MDFVINAVLKKEFPNDNDLITKLKKIISRKLSSVNVDYKKYFQMIIIKR